jgi:HSP20 family protein
MAKQEQPVQQTQGRDMTRATAPRGYLTVRNTGYPAGLLMAPGDLFRLGPFALMRRMSEEMDRVMEEFGMNRADAGTSAWAPRVEVSQQDGNYQVRAELPGINPSDVKLEHTDEALIIEGERKSETHENKGGVQLTERQYGRFYRSIPLPEGAKGEEAKARFENGVLEVTVPVQEPKETRRQIPIESAAAAPAEAPGKAA